MFIGFDSEGKEQYLRFGKQFRELFEWMNNPARTLGNKTSPVVRQAVIQMSGVSPSGWKTPITKARTRGAAIGTRVAELGKMFLPYSVTSLKRSEFHPAALAFPISKGMTKYKARLLFIEALKRGDEKKVAEIYAGALRNKLNADKILKSARKSVKKRKK